MIKCVLYVLVSVRLDYNSYYNRGVGIRYWDAYNILKQRFASEDSGVRISVQRFSIFYCGVLLLVNGT